MLIHLASQMVARERAINENIGVRLIMAYAPTTASDTSGVTSRPSKLTIWEVVPIPLSLPLLNDADVVLLPLPLMFASPLSTFTVIVTGPFFFVVNEVSVVVIDDDDCLLDERLVEDDDDDVFFSFFTVGVGPSEVLEESSVFTRLTVDGTFLVPLLLIL
jgi:hypothetical protein